MTDGRSFPVEETRTSSSGSLLVFFVVHTQAFSRIENALCGRSYTNIPSVLLTKVHETNPPCVVTSCENHCLCPELVAQDVAGRASETESRTDNPDDSFGDHASERPRLRVIRLSSMV